MKGKYLATWTRPDDAVRRQIDYIPTHAKCMNAEGPARRNDYWHANMNQNQPRRVQTTQIYYNDANKYKTPTPSDTGKILKYDILEL